MYVHHINYKKIGALLFEKDIRRLAALGHCTILIDLIMALFRSRIFPTSS